MTTANNTDLPLPKIWSDTLIEFTANQIPIHLIDLQTLHLVSRSDVAQHYRPILEVYLRKHPSLRTAHQRDITRAVFKIVKYAIFSHRWLAVGEPTFQDISRIGTVSGTLSDEALAQLLDAQVPDHHIRVGLHKLLMFCSKARTYNCRFAWSDTCCINKESSAELDESIRSMFRWYHNSFICIAHLGGSLTLDDIVADEWFTRGWTLQELLAPENIKFFNRDWHPFTDAKNDKDRKNNELPLSEKNPVWQAILDATHIPEGRLSYFSPGPFDIAQRMSWAVGRRTTRVEDMAYALVGIFGISMAVQYGEGKFAFHRLMEALLHRVDGYEILAWVGASSMQSNALPASIESYPVGGTDDFASVPDAFGDPSMTLTHKGLQVEVLLVSMQCRGELEGGIDSESSSEESTDCGTDSVAGRRFDDGDDKSNDSNKSVTAPTHSEGVDHESDSDSGSDDLHIRFLGNDDSPVTGAEHHLTSLFHFDDPSGILKPLSVRGSGPIVVVDDPFVLPNASSTQYAFAILDYRRDWERGPGCVYVPYSQKSRYLAFVLFREDVDEVWKKLQTDELVYVEVEADKVYEGQTVNVCLGKRFT